VKFSPEEIQGLSPAQKKAILDHLLQKKNNRPASDSVSYGQKALWFIDQSSGHQAIYIIPCAARIRSVLDVGVFRKALNALIERHPSLRTNIISKDGTPRALIHPQQEIDLIIRDVSACGMEEIEALMIRDYQSPFNLAEGPLLRARLYSKGPENHILLIAIHHIVCDGWSVWLMLDELVELYAALMESRLPTLVQLRQTFSDYVRWQNDLVKSPDGEKLREYWKTKLGGELPALNLPTDRPRPAVQTYRGDTHTFKISEELSARIKQSAKDEKVTVFTWLMAVYQLLLHRYTGQDEIIAGFPTAGRNQSGFSGLVGYFTNMVALRSQFSQGMSFRSLLSQVRESVLEGIAHQDFPFACLVELLQPKRDLSRTPVFQTAFTLQRPHKFHQVSELLAGDEHSAAVEWGPLTVEPFNFHEKESHFDLNLEMVEARGSFYGFIRFNTDLFDASTMDRLALHFTTLIESVLADPSGELHRYPLLSAGEKLQLMNHWNATAAGYPPVRCVHQLFELQAKRTPEAVAVEFEGQLFTYKELDQKADRLARRLQMCGIGPDVLVGVLLERSPELVIALLAVLKAGGAYVPLDPLYPQNRIEFILEDAQAPVLLTDKKNLAAYESLSAKVLCVDDVPGEALTSPLIESVLPEHLAYVIFTSGSTGKPKGVQIQHQAVVNFLTSMSIEPGLTKRDVLLAVTTVSFDIAGLEIFLPLTTGGRILLASRMDALDARRLIELSKRATVLQATPATWRMLVEAGWQGHPGLTMLCGGEALQKSLSRQLVPKGKTLWNMYGPTETTIWSSIKNITAQYQKMNTNDPRPDGNESIGRPIANTQFYVLDRHQQLLPVGVPGELYIGGDGLAKGYLNRDELTREKFVVCPALSGQRLYRTGDLVRYLTDGSVEYLGRMDHQVKIRGYRIELGEIEAVMSQQEGILHCAVIAHGETAGEKKLVAYYSAADKPVSVAQVREFLKPRLPEYMLPTLIYCLPAIPLTPNGKVDRKSLPDPLRLQPLSDEQVISPRTGEEQQLADIWKKLLGLHQVGIRDNFFEIGGHSILVTQLISRVRDVFNVEIQLRQIFESPTIELMAAIILELQGHKTGPDTFTIHPVKREGMLPLSFSQQRIWFHEQAQGPSPTYNLAFAVQIKGAMDEALVQRTFQMIIDRHEVLRTNFISKEGQAVQIISQGRSLTMPVIDIETVPASQRLAEAQRQIDLETQRPFDLERDQLLRLTLLKLESNRHILLLTMHHIISDGWSMGVILREFKTIYQSLKAGHDHPLPDLAVQYIDFAAWQRGWLQGEVLEHQLDFWKQKLSGAPALLELPTDRPRPVAESFDGDNIPLTIGPELYAALKDFSRQNGVTVFMALQAVFVLLLARYSGKDDIVIGSPVANRHNSDTETMIGYFVNSLVLRTDVSGDPSFNSLLQRVKTTDLDAFNYPHVPFEQLADRLGVKRNLSHAPWFQVFFVLQNAPVEELRAEDLTLSLMEQRNQTSMFDLTLDMQEQGDAISGILQYKTALFNRGTAQRLAGYFQNLLRQVIDAPHKNVSDYTLLSADQQKLILVDFNQTERANPSERCLQQFFEEHVRKTPDKIALVSGDQELSYQELNQWANKVARYLIEAGASADSLIGISMERSLEMVVGLLGILKSGAAYVPIDPDYPAERKDFMLKDAQIKIMVTRELVKELSDYSAMDANPETRTRPQHLAYIIYTSGTTGQPKGVMIQHDSLVNYIFSIIETLGLSEQDRVLQFSSISFDAAAEEIYMTLLAGATLVLRDDEMIRSAAAFVESSVKHQISVWDMPTAYWHQLSAEMIMKNIPLPPKIRVVLFGGEKLQAETMKKWISRYPDQPVVFNTYGPTETTIVATVHKINHQAFSSHPLPEVPIGRPVANLKSYILDKNLKPVPLGVPGELYFSGLGLARGYLHRPELTAQKFIPNPFSQSSEHSRLYRTGDLARYLENGDIEYGGRADRQVKIRGYRIELSEIENVLANYAGISETLVLAREHQPGQKILIAYAAVHAETKPEPRQLREYLKQRLPDYMVPSFVVVLDHFPLTVNGKVDEQALPRPEESAEKRTDFIAPRNTQEETMAGLWQEVLGLGPVSIHDNFFELGGHSLLAAQLVTRIYESFKVDLPLRKLFESPTVAALTIQLQSLTRIEHTSKLIDIQPVSRAQILPLSMAQRRLWFLDQLEGDNATYNMPAAIRMKGPLDVSLFERVFSEIIRRHETLRTRFPAQEGTPYQVIDEPAEFKMSVVDVSKIPEQQREAEIQRLADQEAVWPFNLAQGPLVRAELLRIHEQDHVLLFTMHHIISDGWSTEILIKEFRVLYNAFYHGQISPLPELDVQYADFAHWQNQYLQGPVLEEELRFWEEKLRGAPALLEMPTDRIRPAFETFRGKNISYTIDADLARRINDLARQNGATLFIVLHAAVAMLLSRYSRQDDIVIGSPLANRPAKKIEPLIGFFVNTMVLRSNLSGNPTFLELLSRIRDNDLEAFDHPLVPFEQLVDQLKPERSLSHSPWFQVMLVLQNTPMEKDTQIAHLTLEPLTQDTRTAKFELTFGFLETSEGITGTLEFNTDLYAESTARLMIAYLKNLFQQITADPQKNISAYSLNENPKQPLLLRGDSHEDLMFTEKTVIHLFEEQAQQSPDSTAVEFEGRKITYRDLNVRANQLGNYLKTFGVGPEVCVGLCMERSLDMIVALLGILKAGGAYVPVDPQYPSERLEFMFTDSAVPVILTQKKIRPLIPAGSARVICIDEDFENFARNTNGVYRKNFLSGVTPEHLAYVIYTSGTSGQPKGVMVEHRALLNFVMAAAETYAVSAYDRVLQFASLSFDAAAEEIFPCLLSGATLVLRTDHMISSAETFLDACRALSLTVLDLPTAYWHQLAAHLNQPAEIPSSLRLVIIGGERVKPEQVKLWNQKVGQAVTLINTYGPTESTVVASLYTVSGQENPGAVLQEIPIGKPLPNTTLLVLDEQLQPVPAGIPGELCIGGAGLARGYLNQPDLTKEKFIEYPLADGKTIRLYRTGDLVRCRPDGQLEFKGRTDRQVKIRGFRVELKEIESVLAQIPHVLENVVTFHDDPSGQTRLSAYIVSNFPELNARSVQEYLKGKLPAFMVPSFFIFVDQIPLTVNGKVDLARLPKPDGTRDAVSAEYTAPRSDMEEQLARIWAEVLGVERVGVHDDFFDLGGHSLIATQLISKARTHLNVELSLRALFESSTVAKMAGRIVAQTPEQRKMSLPVIKKSAARTSYPLSFTQARLWEAYLKDKKNPKFNIPAALRIKGEVDHDLLTRSLNTVVRRQAALRTTFHTSQGQAVQKVHPKQQMTVPVVDLSGLDLETQTAEVSRLIETDAHTLFNLTRGPLFQVTLIKLAAADWVLVMNMHHIISDGWSMDVLVREVMTCYEMCLRGQELRLPELTVQYTDYVLWQRELLDSEIYARQLDYWKKKLAGIPELLNLPLDRPRPPKQSDSGGFTYVRFDQELTQRIKLFCQNSRRGVTLFNFLETVFALMLAQYSGQKDIVVGSTFAARHTGELEQLIGVFVETIILRTEIQHDPVFMDLLAQKSAAATEAWDNALLPYTKLKEALNPKDDKSYNAVFQVKFLLQNFRSGELKESGVAYTFINPEVKKAKNDLMLVFNENGLELEGELSYRTELFDAKTAEQILVKYRNLVETVLRDPYKKVSEYACKSLVPVQSKGTNTPFFCVHPVGGNVFCYGNLAKLLGKNQPFYALQSAGLEGNPAELTVEEMAEVYIREMKSVQPQGPYYLGGWSMGGVIAYEMAQQLAGRHEETKLLVLIDSYTPSVSASALDEPALLIRFCADLEGITKKRIRLDESLLKSMPPAEQFRYFLAQARILEVFPESISETYIHNIFNVFKANSRALQNYAVKPYGGNAVQFYASAEDVNPFKDKSLGWKKWIKGSLDIHPVPGNHYTLVQPPNVDVLSKHLKVYLEQQNEQPVAEGVLV